MSQALERYRPRIFIGSSSERLPIARSIHANLTADAECTVWDKSNNLSENVLANLLGVLTESDFGIFILAPDDAVVMRGKVSLKTRDNVLFELGLFIGGLGIERTFFIVPDNVPKSEFDLPTDLAGIIYGTYEASRTDGSWRSATSPVCDLIREKMAKIRAAESRPDTQINAAAQQAAPLPTDSNDSQLDGSGITASKHGTGYILLGNTKSHSDIIKTIKAKWFYPKKGWLVSSEDLDELRKKLPRISVKP